MGNRANGKAATCCATRSKAERTRLIHGGTTWLPSLPCARFSNSERPAARWPDPPGIRTGDEGHLGLLARVHKGLVGGALFLEAAIAKVPETGGELGDGIHGPLQDATHRTFLL